MKINEVEALVGITRKNIRFYEAEGLLSPRRNSENGYRDYGEAEVQTLLRIKLLRKLGVSLEEIRKMQGGIHTVGDGMRRHLVSLERDRDNLEQAIRLCAGLTDRQERLSDLDAGSVLRLPGSAALDHLPELGKRASGAAAGGAGAGSPGDHRRGGAGPGAADTGDRERRDRRCEKLLTGPEKRSPPS